MQISGKHNQNTRVVFFGNERLATAVSTSTPVLQSLIDAGFTIPAVVSNYSTATSRKSRQLEIAATAEKYDIPLLFPDRLPDIKQRLVDYKADVAVLVAFGKIVPQSVIDVFPAGIINIHPSLLPKHRGPTPLESVILNGEAETGISIMKLVSAMDAGPVYAQSTYQLTGRETKQELADRLSEIGAAMVTDLLPEILHGEVVAVPQDESAATYDRLLEKNDGVIDVKKTAQILEREIRAYAGWPRSTTKLANKDVVITSAEVSSFSGQPGEIIINNNQLHLCCSEGSLNILRLQPSGKKEMTAEAFLAGHREQL